MFDYNSAGFFEIPRASIELLEQIGSGAYAKVYRARCNGTDVAAKVLSRSIRDPAVMRDFQKEVDFTGRQCHQNLCRVMGVCIENPDEPIIISELMETNLEDMMKDRRPPFSKEGPDPAELPRRLFIARDIARGMAWLHMSDPYVLHRDLKPANVLISHEGIVKVCDYGLSQLMPKDGIAQDPQNSDRGSPLWMSPEVLCGSPFDETVDVYAFGIVLWQLVTRHTNPFPWARDINQFRKGISEGQRPDLTGVPVDIADVCEKCWNKDRGMRPKFPDVVKSLDETILNHAVATENVRHWCEMVFGTRSSMPWSTFIKVATSVNDAERASVARHDAIRTGAEQAWFAPTDFSTLDYQAELKAYEDKCTNVLRMLLVNESATEREEEVCAKSVSLERFGQIAGWLAHITGQGRLPRTIWDQLRERAYNLCSAGCFFADLQKEEAHKFLAGRPIGTYLLRFSSQPGLYALSYLDAAGKISHVRIEYDTAADCFVVPGFIDRSNGTHPRHRDLRVLVASLGLHGALYPLASIQFLKYLDPDRFSKAGGAYCFPDDEKSCQSADDSMK